MNLRLPVLGVALAAALVASIGAAVSIGSVDLPLGTVWRVIGAHLHLRGHAGSGTYDDIVWDLRSPRVIAAALEGAGLAVTGVIMQALTRNVLADPYLLGISGGASVGAVCVLVLGLGSGVLALSVGAFTGAIASGVLVMLIAGLTGGLTPVRTVLAGVAIGQLCAAVTSFIVQAHGDPDATRRVEQWNLGSFAGTRWASLWLSAGAVALILLVALGCGRLLDGFAFGEEAAAGLGIPVNGLRWSLFALTTLVTATLVALSGAIGFVGLIVPHAVRLVVGPGHRRLVPLAALVGAIFMVWADVAARTWFSPEELPIGILTAICGVPAFLLLLYRAGSR